MEYEEIKMKGTDEFVLRRNECYENVNIQLPPGDVLSTASTTKFSKVEKNLIVVVAVLSASLMATTALAAAAYIQGIGLMNTLQKELKQIHNQSTLMSKELKLLTSSNTHNIVKIRHNLSEIQHNLLALTSLCSIHNLSSEVETLMEHVTNVTITSNATQNVLDNLAPLLVDSIQDHYVFDSCAAITHFLLPFQSGLYSIRSFNGSPVQLNCMLSCNGILGTWRRVAYLNTSSSSPLQCPSGLEARSDPTSCRRNISDAGCSSVTYHVEGSPYNCISGRLVAHQSGYPDAFTSPSGASRNGNPSLEGNYVDGISLTYGSNPRNHIWTFTAGLDFSGTTIQCANCDHHKPSMIVGSDYSCEINGPCSSGTSVCNEPLWDGNQCVGNATFYKELPQPTTDNIEMRICRDQDRGDEDILITLVEIYVQ